MQPLSAKRPQGRRTARTIALASGLLLVAGCSDLEEFLRPFPDRHPPVDEKIDYHPGQSAIWCYESLGEPDCYSGPQGGPPNRLIETYTDQTAD